MKYESGRELVKAWIPIRFGEPEEGMSHDAKGQNSRR